MIINKCKWKYDAQSPVMFMIDDLANKYIYLEKNNENARGCDWGAKCFQKNSFWDILNGEILNKFPNIKTTMFLVVGRREPIINKGHYFYSEAMNKSDEFIDFIKYLANKPNVELAYHGYSHGICSDDIYKFKEEWETFDNLEEAINSINKGKELFKEVTGKDFIGGKYCGYKYKEFSDKSIAYSDFLWWCRHWDGDLFFNNRDELSFELEEFDNVVDIPSTIDGSFYSLKNWRKIFTKKYLKSVYLLLKKNITLEKQIDYLIKNNLLVSIQEHTAPYRVDTRIQYPNIITDKENLIYIFKYLQKYNLWYATGTEIAEYYKLYKYTELIYSNNKIMVKCNENISNGELTIELEVEKAKEIFLYNTNERIKLSNIKENKFIGEIKVINNNEYNIEIITN